MEATDRRAFILIGCMEERLLYSHRILPEVRRRLGIRKSFPVTSAGGRYSRDLAWALETALKNGYLPEVIVSTDHNPKCGAAKAETRISWDEADEHIIRACAKHGIVPVIIRATVATTTSKIVSWELSPNSPKPMPELQPRCENVLIPAGLGIASLALIGLGAAQFYRSRR